MSIFGSSSLTTPEYNVPTYEGYIEESDTGMEQIISESLSEMYDIQSAIRIADVQMSAAVLEGASFEPLMESVAKDTIAKIRKALTSFWSKIREFFSRVTTYFGTLFVSGKKLTTKYKKQLDESKPGFKYKGYIYDVPAGDGLLEELTRKISDHVKLVGGLDLNSKPSNSSAEYAEKATGHKADRDSKEDFDALLKKLGGDKKELAENIIKTYRSGASDKDEVVDFKGTSKAVLIDIVETGKDSVKSIKEASKKADQNFKWMLDLVKRAEKQASSRKSEGDEEAKANAAVVAALSHQYKLGKEALALQNSLVGVQVKMVKEAVSSSTSVLRSYIVFREKGADKTDDKPEAAAKAEPTEESALLTEALRLI